MENFAALKRIREMAGSESASKRPTGGFKPREPKKPVRYGATCPNCWTKKSLTGECLCI